MLVDAITWLNELNCGTNLGRDNAYRRLLALGARQAPPRRYKVSDTTAPCYEVAFDHAVSSSRLLVSHRVLMRMRSRHCCTVRAAEGAG